MPKVWIARRPARQALLLPLGGTRERPNIIIPLQGVSASELDELVRAVLEKRKLEGELGQLVEKAEMAYEERIKVREAQAELKRRLREQAQYAKLKWGGLRPVRKRW